MSSLIDALALKQQNPDSPSANDRVARAFFEDPRIKRIASFHAHQSGVSETDEIVQEAIIVFMGKTVDRLDDPQNVYFVVTEIFKKVCQGLKRKLISYNEGRYTSLDKTATAASGDEDGYEQIFRLDDDSLANADESCITEVEQRISKDSLREMVRQRIRTDQRLNFLEQEVEKRERQISLSPLVEEVPPIVRPAISSESEKPKSSKQLQSEKDSLELAEIRKRLGYTIEKFARALNISKGQVTAYLYNRAAAPSEVMERARLHMSEIGEASQASLTQYDDRAMRDIAIGWATQLGGNENTAITLLSEVFEVAPVTIKRWMVNKTRPEPQKLREYQRLVSEKAAACSSP